MSQHTRIVIDIKGGQLQSVYGDLLPEGVDIEIILRDQDDIDAGDPDPMGDEYEPETYYW